MPVTEYDVVFKCFLRLELVQVLVQVHFGIEKIDASPVIIACKSVDLINFFHKFSQHERTIVSTMIHE